MDTTIQPPRFTVEDLPRLRYGPGRYELIDGALFVTDGVVTADTLRDLPDDGNGHELWDGMLVVTPAPSRPHQAAVMAMTRLLQDSCPPHLYVTMAPYDVELLPATTVQPDVLVAEDERIGHDVLVGAPLLVVEVLSSSTRAGDLGPKRDLYAQGGCQHYWVVDPTASRLEAFELHDGSYRTVADVGAEETWTATHPYPVTIRPADLVR